MASVALPDDGDDTVQAFSHTHLHGTGATDYGVLAVLPATSFDPAKTSVLDYEAGYAKQDEVARAGLYTLTLDTGVKVELTARGHAGRHRWSFPAGAAEAWAVFDLAKTLSGGEVDDAEVTLDAATRRVRGRLHHVAFWVDTREECLRAADIFVDHDVYIEAAPSKHGVAQGFFLYGFEPGGNRIEVTTGGYFVFDPDYEPVTWTAEERARGQFWGVKTIESFHTYGTPPVE